MSNKIDYIIHNTANHKTHQDSLTPSFHAPSIPTHLCLFSNIYMHWKTWNKIVEKESKTTNKEVKESSTPTIAYTTTSPPLTPIYQVKVDRHNCFFHTPLFWCCGHCCTCGSPSILIMQALSVVPFIFKANSTSRACAVS